MSLDAKAHLIKLPRRIKNKDTNQWETVYDDYLEVKWRVVIFREKFPHGHIETEEVCIELDRVVSVEVGGQRKTGTGYARFKARVEDGEGGVATGYGTENAAEFTDFVERAETRAIGRALAGLGIGTPFVGTELSEGAHVVDAPVVTSAAVTSNGHTPAPAPPKGAPKALVQKSDLLREIQAELTRIGRPVGAVTTLYQAAFGTEVDTWDLVCGESLHTLKHGLAYLKTLTPEVSHGSVSTPQTTPEPAAAAERQPQDPSPAASSSAASDPDADAAERDRQRLRAEVSAWDLRVSEAEIKHIITHHPYSKARQLLWQARRHDTAAD